MMTVMMTMIILIIAIAIITIAVIAIAIIVFPTSRRGADGVSLIMEHKVAAAVLSRCWGWGGRVGPCLCL